jgi:primosomal protein N' (replication factor Y)
METLFADVVLRLALPEPLQFSVPEEMGDRIAPGQKVRVPLRNRTDVGYVVALSTTPRVGGIRPVMEILDPEPLLPQDLLELLLWVSAHNLAPPGLVFRSALPRAVHYEKTSRATARTTTVRSWHLAAGEEDFSDLLARAEKRAPAQAKILSRLAAGPLEQAERSAFSSSALRALVAKGVVEEVRRDVQRGLILPLSADPALPLLTPAQEEVFQAVLPSLSELSPSTFLLHGVTGSGKSEIYIRAVQNLPPQRQAIILVPEVSLTTQLIRHFQERLPFPLAVWHHQLSEGEKFDLWKAIREGGVKAVIGARSAVFAPLPDVGLIVVDEEQESSYKQEETPSYHAREVALRRAELKGATVILGSATPSIESYFLATEGACTLLSLPSRYGDRPLPRVEMIDLKESEDRDATRGLLTEPLLTAAAEALEEGSQVLFFLNRRGYAPFTHCRDCGWSFKCPNCQVSLVFHSPDRSSLCHYCGFRSSSPETCPSCGGARLRLSGTGTQKLEETVQGYFPERSVARLDRDATSRKGAGGRLISSFADGRTDILVGTQMAAKGYHFPRLTVVGVLSPDLSLNLPDFRAAERTFQVVTQVAGRAGRGEKPGVVLIQTYQPEHYALKAAVHHDFLEFYRKEIDFRRELDYPPFCDLVLLRTDGVNLSNLEEVTDRLASGVRRRLEERGGEGRWQLLGPVPAPLRKIRNRYRFQILIKARPLERATSVLRERLAGMSAFVQRAHCRLTVDVNPQNMM